MDRIYKSVTLNLMAFLGIISLTFFGKSFFEIITTSQEGSGDFFAFFYIPASFLYMGLIIIGLLVEYICKQSNIKVAFNFPYRRICLNAIYYPFFYIGLIWGVLPAIYFIAALIF